MSAYFRKNENLCFCLSLLSRPWSVIVSSLGKRVIVGMEITCMNFDPDVCIFSFNDCVVFVKIIVGIFLLYIIHLRATDSKYTLIFWPLYRILLRADIFSKMFRISEPQPWISFIFTWTQL